MDEDKLSLQEETAALDRKERKDALEERKKLLEVKGSLAKKLQYILFFVWGTIATERQRCPNNVILDLPQCCIQTLKFQSSAAPLHMKTTGAFSNWTILLKPWLVHICLRTFYDHYTAPFTALISKLKHFHCNRFG